MSRIIMFEENIIKTPAIRIVIQSLFDSLKSITLGWGQGADRNVPKWHTIHAPYCAP